MVERRTLLSGGMAASVGALLGAPAPAAAAASEESVATTQVAQSIDGLRRSLERQAEIAPALRRLRTQQHTFLKASQKFPDFMEVGIGVWEEISDWYFTHQQALTVGRLADGRYAMTVAFTTLILRPDQDEDYVGFGFDAPPASA